MSINAPVIPNPVMLDRIIGEIQTGLVENLPWLDVAFGRSQRLTKMMNGKKIITPNVYCGGWNGHDENDYIETSPDSKIGNFSFFEIEDPQTIDAGPWARQIKAPFGLIVWFDLTRVYNEPANRNTEYIKAQILRVLNGRAGWHLTGGRIVLNRIYERAENIYRGYTLSEINNQFLMHPFAGLRFDGFLMFDELCMVEEQPVFPYQKIEYLESDGKQYIYTGVNGGQNVVLEVDVRGIKDNVFCFGSRESSSANAFALSNGGASGNQYDTLFMNYGNTYKTINITYEDRHVISFGKTVYVDGVLVAEFSGQNDFETPFGLCLFAFASNGPNFRFGKQRVYGVRIYQNQQLVRNYIPVRIGEIGYLYDDISKTLYQNNGLEPFILGPDIV